MLHLTDRSAVDGWLNQGGKEPATIEGVDLSGLAAKFAKVSVRGCAFLGCAMDADLARQIHEQGAGVVSELGVLPSSLPAFRRGLYTVAELYRGLDGQTGGNWEQTPDYAGYRWFNARKNVPRELGPAEIVAARLHDTAQEQAVRAFLHGRKVVAIMGGHDFKRRPEKAGAADVYWDCVNIARQLTEKGFLVLTGGGPGLMEAGNLGALLAGSPDSMVDEVRAILENAKFEEPKWRATAAKARARILGAWDALPPRERWSLGIPTWFYGHEPPNLFASHHSKMFYNSLREDGLVTLANSGIIYFEGNGGTVQEIFQDAAQNYYVGEGQSPTPMVFYNVGGYWDRSCTDLSKPTDEPKDKRKPLLPLIRQLAIEKNFMQAVLVTESPDRVVEFLVSSAEAVTRPTKADVRMHNIGS